MTVAPPIGNPKCSEDHFVVNQPHCGFFEKFSVPNKNTLSDNIIVYKSYRAAVEILHIIVVSRNKIKFSHTFSAVTIIIKSNFVDTFLIINKVRFIIQVMIMPQLA